MARIMNGDITKPSETTVTEDTSDEPVQLEEVKKRISMHQVRVISFHYLKFQIKYSRKNDG